LLFTFALFQYQNLLYTIKFDENPFFNWLKGKKSFVNKTLYVDHAYDYKPSFSNNWVLNHNECGDNCYSNWSNNSMVEWVDYPNASKQQHSISYNHPNG